MKTISAIIIILAILSASFLIGCKNSDNPTSAIGEDTVPLTEPRGTTYTGNYFPIQEGYTCNYSGSASVRTKTVIPGENPTDRTTNVPAYGMLSVLAQRNIPLSSGPVLLYPVVEVTDMQGSVMYDSSRFFMKDTQAVYVKAIRLGDGTYLEVSNPVYIKSRLVVGDSWETSPKIDVTKLLTDGLGQLGLNADMTMNARSTFFVLGHETISLPFGMRNAMKLQQINNITMSGSVIMEGHTVTINVTARPQIVYHLIADTGIVHQEMTGPLDMSIAIEGEVATVSIIFNSVDLKLTSVWTGPGYRNDKITFNERTVVNHQVPAFTSPAEEKLWNISQAIVKKLIKKLSL